MDDNKSFSSEEHLLTVGEYLSMNPDVVNDPHWVKGICFKNGIKYQWQEELIKKFEAKNDEDFDLYEYQEEDDETEDNCFGLLGQYVEVDSFEDGYFLFDEMPDAATIRCKVLPFRRRYKQ